MKFEWRTIVAIVFFFFLFMMQIAYWIDPITLADIVAVRDALVHYVHQFPVLSVFIYISCYTVTIVFGIPISATIIGGYFFGAWWGTLYTFFAICLGSIILCSVSRYVLYDWIQKRYKKELGPFSKSIESYGIIYVAMIHALPFVPSFLPHIVVSLSSLPLYNIIIANSVGALPLTFFYAVAGSYLHSLSSLRSFVLYATICGVVFACLWFAAVAIRYWYNHNKT